MPRPRFTIDPAMRRRLERHHGQPLGEITAWHAIPGGWEVTERTPDGDRIVEILHGFSGV